MRVGGEGWTMLDVKFSGDNFELFRVEIQHNVILVYGTVVARMLDGLFFGRVIHLKLQTYKPCKDVLIKLLHQETPFF